VQLDRYPFRAMGCPCQLWLYGESAAHSDAIAAEARGEVARLERKYSRYRDDSLAAAIRRSAGDPRGIELDAETAALLDYAQECHRQSGGLFDITSGVLRRAWKLDSGRLPTRRELAAVRRLVGWRHLRWERPRLVLTRPGMELDFGGYVKEYAVDRVAELCAARGVRHGLVDFGGDLRALGPHPDGQPWIVGIRDPQRRRGALAALPLRAGAVATSGDYERCMVVDGVRYGHILDPTTGWPVEGLVSASALAPSCLLAGTATTIAMLLGESAGPRWLGELGLPHLTLDRWGRLTGTLAPGDTSELRPPQGRPPSLA
jgi:thiamine biosynthesis lipoprotein